MYAVANDSSLFLNLSISGKSAAATLSSACTVGRMYALKVSLILAPAPSIFTAPICSTSSRQTSSLPLFHSKSITIIGRFPFSAPFGLLLYEQASLYHNLPKRHSIGAFPRSCCEEKYMVATFRHAPYFIQYGISGCSSGPSGTTTSVRAGPYKALCQRIMSPNVCPCSS